MIEIETLQWVLSMSIGQNKNSVLDCNGHITLFTIIACSEYPHLILRRQRFLFILSHFVSVMMHVSAYSFKQKHLIR